MVLIDGGVRRPLTCGFPENPFLVGSSAMTGDKEDPKHGTDNFWSSREREREREMKGKTHHEEGLGPRC